MIFILSSVAFWFAQLSGIPQYIIDKAVEFNWPKWLKYLVSKLACTKCISFWVGLFWYYDIILAALCSFITIVISRIYYKLLS